MSKRAVVILNLIGKNKKVDVDIPLDLNSSELVTAISNAYQLNIDTTNPTKLFISTQNPVALIRGKATLEDYGVHDGTIINFIC